MSDIAICVDHLSKAYQIGPQQTGAYDGDYRSLRDALTTRLSSFLRFANGRRKLERRTQTFWALNNLNFAVKQGEVLGIIGRNGAGKSTLLKILSRITEPTTGEVTLYGRVGSLLEVGAGFHPELTGRENIYLNGAILGMKRSEIRRKFEEMVAFAEIERFLDTPVKHYSSGMYTRLAFAVAAHLEPEILLVDEVLAVGDLQFQKKCLGKMDDIAKRGRTVLFVSHNVEAIRALCTKVIHLQDGQITSMGPAEKEVQAYLQSQQESIPITPANPYHVSHDLTIQQLAITPDCVMSGAAMQLQLTFYSASLVSLREVAVIISSATGVRVAVMKIDVEGWEFYMLQGAQATLCRTDAPDLLVEFTEVNANAAGVTGKLVYELLLAYGYTLYHIDAKQKVFYPAVAQSYEWENLLATKSIVQVCKRTGYVYGQ